MISGHEVLEVLPVCPALLPCQGGDCLQPSPRGVVAGQLGPPHCREHPQQFHALAACTEISNGGEHCTFPQKQQQSLSSRVWVSESFTGIRVLGWCVMEVLQDCCVLEMTPVEFGYLKEKGNLCQKILCINGSPLGLVVTYWCIAILLIHLKLFIFGAS